MTAPIHPHTPPRGCKASLYPPLIAVTNRAA